MWFPCGCGGRRLPRPSSAETWHLLPFRLDAHNNQHVTTATTGPSTAVSNTWNTRVPGSNMCFEEVSLENFARASTSTNVPPIDQPKDIDEPKCKKKRVLLHTGLKQFYRGTKPVFHCSNKESGLKHMSKQRKKVSELEDADFRQQSQMLSP